MCKLISIYNKNFLILPDVVRFDSSRVHKSIHNVHKICKIMIFFYILKLYHFKEYLIVGAIINSVERECSSFAS